MYGVNKGDVSVSERDIGIGRMQILHSQSGYLSQQAESVWDLLLIVVFIYWKSLMFRKPNRPRDPPRDSRQASTYISSLSYGSQTSTGCSKKRYTDVIL
jgi:nitric oxide reductase large subunit